MKLMSPLYLTGNPIKGVADPREPGDAVNKRTLDKIIASWTGTRYFAVSQRIGSDSNTGYSDISMLDASKQAVCSVEKLTELIPPIGAGASIRIAIESGNYGDINLSLMGYDSIDIIGTCTDKSANSVAFSDDEATIKFAGATVLGRYNFDKCESNSFFKLLNLNGSLPDFSDNNNKLRARFDINTTTILLRDTHYNLAPLPKYQGYIELINQTSVCPDTTDLVYIEQPGIYLNKFSIAVQTFGLVSIQGLMSKQMIIRGTTFQDFCSVVVG